MSRRSAVTSAARTFLADHLPAERRAVVGVPCVNGKADIHPCKNVDLLSVLPLSGMGGGNGNDVWGWTDPSSGKEYAIVGRTNGTAFVDVSTPTSEVPRQPAVQRRQQFVAGHEGVRGPRVHRRGHDHRARDDRLAVHRGVRGRPRGGRAGAVPTRWPGAPGHGVSRLLRDPDDMHVFQHVHPTLVGDTWRTALTPADRGEYRQLLEFSHGVTVHTASFTVAVS